MISVRFNGSRGSALCVVSWARALCMTCGACGLDAKADVVTFFDSSQIATPAGSGPTSESVSSEGHKFTYTRDNFFTGGGSVPIGRSPVVVWPDGVQAQSVTAGPILSKAKIIIERLDGRLFDLTAFDAQLLANTCGAGGTFEVVPFLDGEEVFQDPVTFEATGFYGQVFSYDTSPNPFGSTILLKDFDKYSIDLYVDFAWVGLTLNSAAVQPD